MKKFFVAALMAFFLVGITSVAFAGAHGTKAEAEAMVKKAIAYIKEHGKEKAFAEFDNKNGKFVDRDLYVMVYDMTGTTLAHGANQKMVGKNFIDMKDPDGVPFVKERIELAKTKGKGWQEYKFTNPVTKKIEPKIVYIEKYEDMIVCCGAYK
ncbi:MAG: cache domain-containing protein [Dissulfurispiraceae bacterium]